MATTKQRDKTAGNEPSSPKFGHEQLKQSQKSSVGKSASPSSNSTTGGKTSFSTDALKKKEADNLSNSTSPGKTTLSSDEPEAGFKYTPGSSSQTSKGRTSFTKKRAAIAGAILTALATAIIGFLLLIPLKIEHMIKNLDRAFSQTTTAALQKEEQNALRQYYKKYIIGNASCGVRVHKDCAITGTANNPMTKTYKAWRDANVEGTWSKKYGIEIQYRAGQYYLKAPGTAAGGDALGADAATAGKNFDGEFTKSSRAEIRKAFNDAYEQETQKTNIYKRYIAGKLLEEKYGIKRCIVFCGTRDSLADHKDDQKYAAKIFLIERVIQPRSASLGVILDCILNDKCTNTDPNNHCAASICNELEGEAQDGGEQAVEDSLKESTALFGSAKADAIIAIINDARAKGGFQNYVLDKTLTKLISKEFSDKAIPVIGWVFLFDRATTIVHDTGEGSLLYKKYAYLANAPTAIALYQEYQTYADEIHTGNVSATEVGSFVNSLSAGNQCATDLVGDCGQQKGGTAGAEQTKIYQVVMSGKSLDQVSGVNQVCDNGNSLTAVQPVCPEERLGVNSDVLDSIKSFEDNSGLTAVTDIYRSACVGIPFTSIKECLHDFIQSANNLVSWLLGPAGGAIGFVFEHLPGYSTVAAAVDKFINYLAGQFIPNPFGVAMGGGRTFDMMAAGADATNHDTCESIGCQKVDAVAYNNIVNSQFQQEKADFASLPLGSRLFNTNSSYSLASQFVDSLPLNPQTALANSATGILHLNFSSAFTSALHLFGNKKAEALNLTADPYGVTQTAYPADKIPDDPEAYWDSHNCGDTTENGPIAMWAQAAKVAPADPDNGMPVHTDVEPCLLINKTASSVGAKYDSSLLSPDEQTDIPGI